jgi:8-oxo-dGTP diphosphatase
MKKGVDYVGVTVVFFCHDGKGNYLLSKRSKNCRDEHGCWDPGGGGVDFGENVIDVLKREIKEEYCADIKEYEELGFLDVHRENDGKPTHWIALFYRVLVNPKQVANGEPHKFDELGWFRLDNLPKPLHSQFPAALRKYKDKLI